MGARVFCIEIMMVGCEILRIYNEVTAWSCGCEPLALVANVERSCALQSLMGTVIFKAYL